MNKELEVRLRIITIKSDKVLLTYDSEGDYFFYVGGRLEYGETIEQGAQREIREECGEDTTFGLKKILYIRDFMLLVEGTHSVELFILGDINKFEELEGRKDPEFGDRNWLTWRDVHNLPPNTYPTELTQKLATDYRNNFPNQGEYLGKID